MIFNKATLLLFTIVTILMVHSCGKDSITNIPINKTGLLEKVSNKIIFHSMGSQDFKGSLDDFKSVNGSLLSGEESILKGLAHIYLGEVYEVAAQILSAMQLDLYYKSIDPDHGRKFPIIQKDEIEDIKKHLKLNFWMGLDVCNIYGKNERDLLLKSISSDKIDKNINNIFNVYVNNANTYRSQTFLSLDEIPNGLVTWFPFLGKILEAEQLYKNQDYEKALGYIDDEGLWDHDIFKNDTNVQYYSSAVIKLASLAHYKLGIKELENSFEKEFKKPDSTGYRIIAVLNLGQKYHFFEDHKNLSKLWKENKEFLTEESNLIEKLVEDRDIRMPYCLDWIRFEDAIQNDLETTLPTDLTFLNDPSDYLLQTIKYFIRNHSDSKKQSEIPRVLSDFKQNPEKIDNYPTLMSGFIKELNLSPFSRTNKNSIQDLTENLVFNIKHSKKSYHRNRPAFLLSLYGTLRWHGGKLPDINGFQIELKNRDNALNPLVEISALFTQAFFSI